LSIWPLLANSEKGRPQSPVVIKERLISKRLRYWRTL